MELLRKPRLVAAILLVCLLVSLISGCQRPNPEKPVHIVSMMGKNPQYVESLVGKPTETGKRDDDGAFFSVYNKDGWQVHVSYLPVQGRDTAFAADAFLPKGTGSSHMNVQQFIGFGTDSKPDDCTKDGPVDTCDWRGIRIDNREYVIRVQRDERGEWRATITRQDLF